MGTLKAIDLFAGAGGATQGLKDSGFEVVGAIENDEDAATSYALNHPATRMWAEDIRDVPASVMRYELGLERGELALLKACPPCQGFSTLATGRVSVDEERNDLVGVTVRFVREFLPRAVLVENVPGLGKDARIPALLNRLARLGYGTATYAVNAEQFGVPQRRKRFILIAVRGKRRSRDLPDSLESVGDLLGGKVTVRSAFTELQAQLDPDDELNRSRRMSELVKRRVQSIPIGGTRFDLPLELQLKCHRRLADAGRNATSSYGRMKWDDVSPTMTTRCTTPACGSFVHPDEDRGITLREAATLQTFPATYKFAGSYGSIERQIGNAVPVRMAAQLGRRIVMMLGASPPTPTVDRARSSSELFAP